MLYEHDIDFVFDRLSDGFDQTFAIRGSYLMANSEFGSASVFDVDFDYSRFAPMSLSRFVR